MFLIWIEVLKVQNKVYLIFINTIKMKILIIGAGGIGGYFGGKLAQAGLDVTFLVRGRNYEALKQNGLQVNSINDDFKVHPKVIDDVNNLNESPDLIILGVKSWQVIGVAQQLKSIVGKNTMVLPLQNGADNVDKLLSVLPKENVLAGLCFIVSKIVSPGIINHFAYEPKIIFGEKNNTKTKRILAVKEVFDKAEIKNNISDDIQLDIWRKFLFITTYSGIGALTRQPIGAFIKIPFINQMMKDTAHEVMQIAIHKNISLSKADIDKTMHILENMDYDTTASMQRDMMDGKPSELENFNGYIVKEGLRLKINTPVNNFIYYTLLPAENFARKLV